MFDSNKGQSLWSASARSRLDDYSQIEQVGEDSLIIRIQDDIKLSLIQRNTMLKRSLQTVLELEPTWLIDYIISYDSLLLFFDTERSNYRQISAEVRASVNADTEYKQGLLAGFQGKLHIVDACYSMVSSDHPNDMALVEKETGLAQHEIIGLHQALEYHVFAIGFMPNFAYLGELSEKLAVPRLSQPRLKVPAGAIAIADLQTAIYPSETPGGWHIIAHTAFSFTGSNIFGPNDKVKFRAIDEDTYFDQIKQVET
jgi:KipI family sensor histidine kinase inhibitor